MAVEMVVQSSNPLDKVETLNVDAVVCVDAGHFRWAWIENVTSGDIHK